MRNLILCGACAVALAACSPAPSTTSVAPVTGALASVAAFTQTDLAAAITMAKAASPPDTEGAACFAYISTNLATLQGQAAGTSAPVGAFSAFETANLALNGVSNVAGPASKVALEIACGPLAAHVVNAEASMVSEVTALLAQVGIHVAVP